MDENENVTKIGKFLRETGIDELPQIINIFKGEIVLIGPRPLTPQDHEKYRNRMMALKPGMTGYWQISRTQLEEVQWYDDFYLLNRGWLFNIYIIFKTIWLLITRRHYKK